MGIAAAAAYRGGRLRRAVEAQTLVDASWAMASSGSGSGDFDRQILIGATLFQAIGWWAGTALGAFAGTALNNARALGLDAIFPAFFLALLVDQLRSRRARRAALLAATIAVMLIPDTPAGTPVAALCGRGATRSTAASEPGQKPAPVGLAPCTHTSGYLSPYSPSAQRCSRPADRSSLTGLEISARMRRILALLPASVVAGLARDRNLHNNPPPPAHHRRPHRRSGSRWTRAITTGAARARARARSGHHRPATRRLDVVPDRVVPVVRGLAIRCSLEAEGAQAISPKENTG